MAIRETLELDLSRAIAQLDDFERQLDSLLEPVEIPIDTDQVRLTAREFQNIQQSIEAGVEPARAISRATGLIADEAGTADDAFRRVSETMGVSEDEARDLARAVGDSTREANALESDLRQVARSMGLSEEEARQFASEVRRGADATGDLDGTTSELRSSWAAIAGRAIAFLAAAVGINQVLQSGFERFTTIEDATRALTVQLGDAAEAGELLADVLGVVRGTPFNLDQFADAAAQLVAFGVEAQKIPDILTAIGEAAATRGARAPEFVERLVQLFGQITTTGRISGEQITRFAETGVNALVILANSFGVTTDEIRDMVSKGLIPADQAIQAITTGIVEGTEGAAGATVALGGTMEGLRETLSGAKGGLEAAAARAGAELIELASPIILEWVDAATMGFDDFGTSVAGSADSLEVLVNIIAGLPRGFGVLSDLVSLPVDLIKNIGDLGAALIPGVGSTEDLEGAVEELLGTFDNFFDSLQQRVILESFISDLKSGVDPALAFANATAATARNTELTIEGLQALARTSGASDDRLEDATRTMLAVGEAAGFSAGELDVLRLFLAGVVGPATLDDLEGADRVIRRYAPSVEAVGLAAGEATEAIVPFNEAISRIQGISEETGLSVGFIAANIADFDAELVPLVNDLGVAAIEAGVFDQAIGGLAAQLEGLPGVMSAAKDALKDEEDEIVADFAEFLANLNEELQAQEAFELNLAQLRILGFGDLAQVFDDAGLDFAGLLAEVVADPSKAAEAEAELDGQGRNLAQSQIDGFIEGILSGEGEVTDQLIQSIINAAAAADTPEVRQALLDLARNLRIEIPIGIGQIETGFGSAPAVTGIQGSTTNVTNNFFTQPEPTTDTARVSQAVSSVIGGVQ